MAEYSQIITASNINTFQIGLENIMGYLKPNMSEKNILKILVPFELFKVFQ